MLVLRMCWWVSYQCDGVTSLPVGELRVYGCHDCAFGSVTSVMVLQICPWVSYKCVGATIVPVGELRVCGRYDCACG